MQRNSSLLNTKTSKVSNKNNQEEDGLHIERVLQDLADGMLMESRETKFEWATTPAMTIHWAIICYVLQKFSSAKQHILSKFNHEWLPLQDHHHIQSSSPDHYCPSCWQHPETPDHFLACTHHEWAQIWKELHEQLHQHQIKNNISNIFYDLMAYGLYNGRQALHTIKLHHLPQDIQEMQEQQQQVGWAQIYYG